MLHNNRSHPVNQSHKSLLCIDIDIDWTSHFSLNGKHVPKRSVLINTIVNQELLCEVAVHVHEQFTSL